MISGTIGFTAHKPYRARARTRCPVLFVCRHWSSRLHRFLQVRVCDISQVNAVAGTCLLTLEHACRDTLPALCLCAVSRKVLNIDVVHFQVGAFVPFVIVEHGDLNGLLDIVQHKILPSHIKDIPFASRVRLDFYCIASIVEHNVPKCDVAQVSSADRTNGSPVAMSKVAILHQRII